jgi:hypothetical protein
VICARSGDKAVVKVVICAQGMGDMCSRNG